MEEVTVKDKNSDSDSSPAEDTENIVVWKNRVTIVLVAWTIGLQVFPNLAMYYFFKDTLKLNLAQLIFYNSILNFIWVLKPVFGFICDSYSLCGSHRKSYLVLFSVVNSVGWVLMALWVSNLW